jgi:TolB-like protein
LLDALANRRFEPFDRSVDVLVGKLRRKVEPDPKHPLLIATVPGEGYRFDGLTQPLSPKPTPSIADPMLREGPDRRHGSDSPLAEQPPNLGATDREKMPMSERLQPPRLSMVVLPFANIGGDPEHEHFVDGVTESLTTDLSRIRSAVVVARNTAFTYKGKPLDVKTIGRDLNVRYVLEGTVQRNGNRMRVNVQLIDAESAHHLWAERFDKALADLFDMQDEIVARLADALNAKLVAAEARRAERTPSPDSMDLYFQGLALLNTGLTPESGPRARSFFDRALSADPDNVDALYGSGRVDIAEGASNFVTNPRAAFEAAEGKFCKALSSVPDHAQVHLHLGYVKILTNRVPEGIAGCEHALLLDRNLASAHACMDWVRFTLVGPKKQRLILWRRCVSARATQEPPARCTRRATRRITSANGSKRLCGFDGRSRPNETIRMQIFSWPSLLRDWADWTRRVPRSKPASRSTRRSPSPARAPLGQR